MDLALFTAIVVTLSLGFQIVRTWLQHRSNKMQEKQINGEEE